MKGNSTRWYRSVRRIEVPIQLQQAINLFLLLLLGKLFSSLYLSWTMIAVILLFSFLIECFFLQIKYKVLSFVPYASVSTAMGVILMMFSPHLTVYLTVITLALGQKHLIRIAGRHLFNPSNFALMMALLFFYQDAHIVLGQLGDSVWFGAVVIVLGAMILYRVERWIIPVMFSFSYILLQYFLIVNSDPFLLIEDIYERFYAISFIVFVLFMLTDPLTTPERKRDQLYFASMVALIATLLDYQYGFRVQHLFMSLFLLSTTVPLWMEWQSAAHKKRLLLMTMAVLLLALGAIITIEIQPPYYFEMDG